MSRRPGNDARTIGDSPAKCNGTDRTDRSQLAPRLEKEENEPQMARICAHKNFALFLFYPRHQRNPRLKFFRVSRRAPLLWMGPHRGWQSSFTLVVVGGSRCHFGFAQRGPPEGSVRYAPGEAERNGENTRIRRH